MASPRIFGFGLLRNGIQYDYPFLESLLSLKGVCERVRLALGDSQDGTESAIATLDFVDVTPTVWDENERIGGRILSQQTNLALNALREDLRNKGISGAWGIYLQSDEVLNEREHARIRKDIEAADAAGCDAVRFRYLHYWQDYYRIAVGKRWYPQEIRAIRLDSAIESYGDAQSFRGATQIFESDAFIHHFGHVREPERYQKKLREFHRWWHPDSEIPAVIARGEAQDRTEETIAYLGPYPLSMRERMRKHYGGHLPHEQSVGAKVLLLGSGEKYPGLVSRLNARDARFGRLKDAPEAKVVVPIEPTFFERLRVRSKVPPAMRSKHARPWTPEFVAQLKCAERGIASL